MHRSLAPPRALALIGGCVLLAAVAGGALAGPGGPIAQLNETNLTQHEDPATVGDGSDLGRVESWLERHLADRLQGHALQVSEGQYEAAEGMVGDAFEERLDQYVDVAGDTGSETEAEETAESFDTARAAQQNVSETSQAYERTHERYETARERGNTSAARRYARRLDRLASRIQADNRTATRALRRVENRTGVQTAQTRERVATVAQTTAAETAAVREATFIETRPRLLANGSRASFLAPVRLAGTVTSANGSTITDRSVRLRIGGQSYTVRPGRFGLFSVPYRPVVAPAGVRAVPVSYLPAETAPYLGSTANVSLAIEAIEPAVDVSVTPETVRAGERVTVGARVTAGGRPVPGVPVAVSVATRSVGTAVTDATGRVTVLNASVPPGSEGDVPVLAAVAMEGRAIAAASGTTTLAVQPAPDATATPQGQVQPATPPSDAGGRFPLVPVAIVGGVVVVALLGWFAWRRRSGAAAEEASPDPAPVTESETEQDTPDRQWLAVARAALAEGRVEPAITNAYAAAYAHLADAYDLGRDRTPRELLAAGEDRLSAPDLEQLATLTGIYEQTVFGPGCPGDGQDAVEAAERLVDRGGRTAAVSDD